ncbi:MAG: hypothetical protein OXC95_07545 [Dehalococcoidia bacterium]|nr:hypothetical protein [Dehalococcoidia bacterium]
MTFDHEDSLPTFLRWSDYLTGKTCTVRVEPTDVGAPIKRLVSEYLVVQDAGMLVSDRRLLPDSLAQFQAFQDITLTLSDDGLPGPFVPGTVLRIGPRELSPDQAAPCEVVLLNGSYVHLLEVSIDRSDTGYVRNWRGFNQRRWERHANEFQRFVESATDTTCNTDPHLSLDSFRSKTDFLRSIAKAIWDSPFENYSRFTGLRLPYKTADETLLNIIEGRGAICSEKVQALKFLTDAYGFDSGYVFAGPDAVGRLPSSELRRIIETFDFRDARHTMRYWQHIALEYTIDDQHILVDATNGNIPFLFLSGPECEAVLDTDFPQPVPVMMGTYSENFYYHRAPEDLALDLCYAMENYIPEIDLVQVFDNELGLAITPEFLVAPVPFKNDEGFEELHQLYERLVSPNDLEMYVSSEWSLEGHLGESFCAQEPEAASAILDSRDHLLERYDQFEGFGHQMGLAIVRLQSHR